MKIVKIHYLKSEKVKSYKQIETTAKEMQAFLNNGIGGRTGYALAHCQIEDQKPLAFFVCNSDQVGFDKMWEDFAIINPEIVEAKSVVNVSKDPKKEDMRSNVATYKEGCFSFPYRKDKNVKRFYQIKVKYYIRGKYLGLKKIEKVIEGLQAHIFQHEVDHINSKNIYFEK